MVKALVASLALLATAAPAWAGVGTSAYMSASSDTTFWLPSLDVRNGGLLVQIHALDLVGGLPSKVINTGVDVTTVVVKRKIATDVEGVVMPGGGARLLTDTGFNNVGFNLVGQARIGAEVKQGMGFGVYVVPHIGITNIATGDIGLAYGGGLQVSAWLSK
jgi:hypothetical protein